MDDRRLRAEDGRPTKRAELIVSVVVTILSATATALVFFQQMAASRVGRNHFWNTEMDKVLVDALLEQVSKGHKIPNGFKDVAYMAASRAMNSRYGKDMTKEHIKNQVKSLKKKYMAVNTIINTSGFCWDDVNKKIEVTEDVYNAWVAVHPEHKRYFAEKHVLIDDLRHIFGEDYAKGG
ncbi:uncharacterized protein At2g29880-like [Tasmannia lanceolata]|uniref:uncharacterized protein At2g29880-like n=1 Tax=Tasmannia lanceolata TaxID=3420 RepID=UPI004064B9C0